MKEETFPTIWKNIFKIVIVGASLGVGCNPDTFVGA